MNEYLAGALDSNMMVRMVKKENSKYASISVTSKNKKWLEHIKSISGYGSVYDKGRVYEWRVQNQKECLNLLKEVEPHLMLNREKVKEVIEFIEK